MTLLLFLVPFLLGAAPSAAQLVLLARLPRAAQDGRPARTSRSTVVWSLVVAVALLVVLRGSATTGVTQVLWLVLLLIVAALAAAVVFCWRALPTRARADLRGNAPPD